jgi:hypothetical protein
LRQPTANNSVILVETHGNRLPVEDRFPQVLVDYARSLLRGRRSVPAFFPGVGQPADFAGRDSDGPFVFFDLLPAHKSIKHNNGCADDKEMK